MTGEKKPTLAERLMAIAEKDATGGLRILDCKHAFGEMVVILAPGRGAFLVTAWDSKCWSCGKPAGNVRIDRITHCPLCGLSLLGAELPVRNYIISQSPARDERLLALGFFDAPAAAPVFTIVEGAKE